MLHRSVKSVALVMLAALVSFAAFLPVARADYGPQPVTRRLAATKAVAAAWVDSFAFAIPVHATGTAGDTLLIDTSDWDWNVIGASTTANSAAFVNLYFDATGLVASGIDSIFCQTRSSGDGVHWSGVVSAQLITYNNSDAYSRLPLFADQDALNSTSL